MQEVANEDTFKKLAIAGDYPYCHHYENNYLAVLSKFPILQAKNYEFTLSVNVKACGKKLLVVNTHLPWRSALQREKEIVSVIENTRNTDADYTIITGDFNCSVNSSVHRYPKGDQSLLESDAYFVDLAEAYAGIEGSVPAATLNIR